jgi:hypothetical protein
MAHSNLVRSPLVSVVGDVVVVIGALGRMTSGVVAQGSQIKLCNSGIDGHLLVGCLYFSHSA